MAQTLWTKAVGDITIADVISFCEERISESVNLDYKREFPSGDKLAKTVSAFANTFGGLVLIGVDEDDESRPRPPYTGIALEPKLEERVWNVLTEHIQPPLFPDVRVCPPENDRTFVMIRISPSATAPHAVRNNTSIYLRVGNITKREETERLATIPEVSWLADRRAKSVALKQRLVSRAYERCASIRDLYDLTAESPKVHVWLGPKFPTASLLTLAALDDLRAKVNLYADRHSEVSRVHEGIIHSYKGEHDLDTFTETNIFGYTFHSAGITALRLNNPDVVFLSLITDAIADVVRFSSSFLPSAGYWGDLELHVHVRNVRGTRLRRFGDSYFFSQSAQIDETFEISRDLSGFIWRDEELLQDVIGDVLASVAWAFGGRLDVGEVRAYLAKCREWRRASA